MNRAIALVAAVALAVVVPATASAADPSPTGLDRATGYYLALGDSLAAGYQPEIGDDLDGGYVGHVLDDVVASSPRTRLVNLACSGETSVTLVAGGRCDTYELGSQLAQAVDFLTDHGRFTRVVTIDIGANDMQRCVSRATLAIDLACVQAGLRDVATNLPMVLGKLRALAPRAEIVVLNYYNPFLAAYLAGPAGQLTAAQSQALLDSLNGIIAGSATVAGAQVADVETAFRTDVTAPVAVLGLGTVPTNVATICGWTWMCTRQDIHANDTGYAVMAGAVTSRL